MIIVCASLMASTCCIYFHSLSLTRPQELVVSLSKKDPRFELIVRLLLAHDILSDCHVSLPDHSHAFQVAVTPEWQKIGMKNLLKYVKTDLSYSHTTRTRL